MIGADARLRWSQTAHALAPLLFGIPVAVGIAVTLVRALGVTHPDLGFTTAINSDAEAFFLGHTIYQDPADGYTGQLYTPLFPVLVSLLHHVTLWGGWVLLVNFAATFALVGLVAALAYGDGGGASGPWRLLRLVGALGLGGVVWWLVSALPLNLLYDGRSDHTAWAFAFFGLFLLARGADGSRRQLVAAALLLSAGFWAKQPTLVVSLAAAAWLLAAAALRVVDRRLALIWCAGLLALNLAVLGLLNLITHGWEIYFDFELAQKHPRFASFWPSMHELLRFGAPAMVLLLGLAAVATWGARAGFRSGERGLGGYLRAALGGSRDARLAAMLVLTVVIGIPAGVYFRLKVGSDVNQYIGVLWAGGMLIAIAYRYCGERPATALVAAAGIALMFVISQRPTDTAVGARVPPVWKTAEYTEVSPAITDYARHHLVYEQVQSDLNVKPQGSLYPNFYNFIDLLAAGRQPLYLVHALIDRRFDAVAPFRFASPQISLFWEIYASGAGRRESNYFWKLNRVIAAGYAPAPGLPPGFLGRRAGPSRAPWMRSCFGPFELAGVDFGIRAGGGFWCREGDALTLRATPAPRSEVHSLDSVKRVMGALPVSLTGRAGSFEIRLRTGSGRIWSLTGRRASPRSLTLVLTADGRVVGTAQARPGVPLEFATGSPAVRGGGGRVSVTVPDIGSGDLSIRASRGSGARFDFAGLKLDG